MAKLPGKRFEREMIAGWLHEARSAEPSSGAGPCPADTASGHALAITHGAGSNCEAPLSVALAEAFAEAGWWVLRFDLPYRQARAHGPPFPAQAARDREGIRRAVEALRQSAAARVFLGGSSYGGRQATMAVAESPQMADGLLLLSYPLHPPGKPQDLRTAHFPKIETPAMFVHGTRDPFGSTEEMRAAIEAIPARHELVTVDGAPHGLPPKIAAWLPARFTGFTGR
jgi:predicted alpha/beta-hydrolase family hydrolase